MINHSRDSLSHIRSRQQREGIDAARARTEGIPNSYLTSSKVEGEILKIIDTDFKYNKNPLEILHLIDIKNNLSFGDSHIIPIINSLENNIVRVRKGLYFKVDGRYYEVVETPLFDDGMVEARELFPENLNNFPQSHYFDPRQVLSSVVDIKELMPAFIERFGLPNKGTIDTSGFNESILDLTFLDNDGKPHATMEDAIQANDEIHRQRYPRVDSGKDLIFKILPNENIKK